MPVKHLTPDDVEREFIGAFPASRPFDPERFVRLMEALIGPTWEPAGDGIVVLEAEGARLFRVTWEFTIDRRNTSPALALRESALRLQGRLATLFDGGSVSFNTVPWIDKKEDGPVTVVSCSTNGIIDESGNAGPEGPSIARLSNHPSVR
jgi:hypothetical protein